MCEYDNSREVLEQFDEKATWALWLTALCVVSSPIYKLSVQLGTCFPPNTHAMGNDTFGTCCCWVG